jgi:hypothetical protein
MDGCRGEDMDGTESEKGQSAGINYTGCSVDMWLLIGATELDRHRPIA